MSASQTKHILKEESEDEKLSGDRRKIAGKPRICDSRPSMLLSGSPLASRICEKCGARWLTLTQVAKGK